MHLNLNNLLKKAIAHSVIASLNEGSAVSQKAKQMGLRYIGFGRYESGEGDTYKSNGREIIPISGKDKDKKKSGGTVPTMNFYEIFAKKINTYAEQNKEPKSILEMLISLLPKDEQYGNKEMLEKILNGIIPYLNDIVKKLLSNKNFRIKLKEKYLAQFADIKSKDNPINLPSTDINKM
jgi:hypothetical protein